MLLMMTKDMDVKPKLSILKGIAELELESSCRSGIIFRLGNL